MRRPRGNGWIERLTDLLDRFFPRAPRLQPARVPVRVRPGPQPRR